MRFDPTRRALMAGGLAFAAAGCAAPVPPGLPEAEIGFDLWTGQPGAAFGQPVDVTRGSRRIHGPLAWTHPVTGEATTVYARLNRERDGVREQLFALRPDGAGLARVRDRRPGRAERVFTGDVFFPLGRWKGGESRDFAMVEHEGGVQRPLRLTLTVLEPSRAFRGVAASMRYDWIARDPLGKVLFHERYDYSPGTGFVRFDNRLA